MSRPIVTAHHETETYRARDSRGRTVHTFPGVLIEVEFELHDHQSALTTLDRAAEDIRAQIQETS